MMARCFMKRIVRNVKKKKEAEEVQEKPIIKEKVLTKLDSDTYLKEDLEENLGD